jgi:DhnA family fructose-bisphosphate aldolase class Ia
MFSSREFLTDAAMARITDVRVTDPEFGLRSARARTRRDTLATDGKLSLLAADHPARRVTKVGANPIAMSVRQDYLGRILRVLLSDGVDGVMATMDILEDLLVLDACVSQAGGPPLLDGKLLIASLNRGGIAGASWELDDPITGPTPAACAAWGLDGAKMLLRIADDDPGCLKTMLACSEAITQCNALRLPMFLEPLPVVRSEGKWSVQKDAEALARIAGVASALGDSSRHLWLKLPYCPQFETVASSTSLPILLLGGESAGGPGPFLNELAGALRAGPNVRGALVGRNVLYPGDDDPLAIASGIGGMIHRGWTHEQAIDSFGSNRGRHMDAFSQYFR